MIFWPGKMFGGNGDVKRFRKKQWKRWVLCIAAAGLLCLLTACLGKTAGKGESDTLGKKAELTEDTPWNHGFDAILETDEGWYTSGIPDGASVICLRYYDKETGNTILLCNKPECAHGGDDQCEATYKGLVVVNTVLYEGYLYVLGWDGLDMGISLTTSNINKDFNTINLSLYRAALDGSAMDKVGTVFETDNLQRQNVKKRTYAGIYAFQDNGFMIHKGVAYIPYYLQLGEGSAGLRGAGIMKMDLSTGKSEVIEEYDTLQKGIPSCFSGTGDYVYYYRADRNVRKDHPWYRYVISENRIESAEPQISDPELVVSGRTHELLSVEPYFIEDRSYWLAASSKEGEEDRIAVLVFQVSTGELLSEECLETEIPFDKKKSRLNVRQNGYYSMTYYDGKFLIADARKAYFCDMQGKIVGEISVPNEELGIKDVSRNLYVSFKISKEKLYLIFSDGSNFYSRVLYCPLEDVYKKQGTWTDAYRIQGIITWEESQKYMQNLDLR